MYRHLVETTPSQSETVVAVSVDRPDRPHCSGKYDNNTLCAKTFALSFGALKDLMAFVPSGALVPATTATVTIRMRDDIIEMLDMVECQGLPTSQTSDMG